MNATDGKPKLTAALIDAADAVSHINWASSMGIPTGACIPISVFAGSFLKARGVTTDARPVEAGMVVIDPSSPRRGYFGPKDAVDEEDILSGADAKGLDFFGHMVTWLPTHRIVVDLSLNTQGSLVLGALGVNAHDMNVVVGQVDHTRNKIGFRVSLGRGTLLYRLYPRRDGWIRRSWPFDSIRRLGDGLGSGAMALPEEGGSILI